MGSNWITKIMEELRSHGWGVVKRSYGLRVTSRGSVGSNEVTRSLGHMEVMRPFGGHTVTFTAVPGNPGGPRGPGSPKGPRDPGGP